MFKLYRILPILVQNVLVTLRNIYVLNYKYGYVPFFNPLKKIQQDLRTNPPLESFDNHLCKLKSLLHYSSQNTSYYSKIRKKNISSIKDFEEQIPILSKEQVKKRINDFYSRDIFLNNYVKYSTSGSTGMPLKGFISKKDLRERYRLILSKVIKTGADLSKPYARFIGHDVTDGKGIYRIDFINNQLFLSVNDLSEESIVSYYKVLKKKKIETIEGYPSTIFSLVKLLEKNKLSLPDIKFVITTAEKLLDRQKIHIEKFFNVKVFDFYGSNEGSVFAYSNMHGTYTVCDSTAYLEVLDNQNRFVGKGEEGRMIITGYLTKFTPLIRYDIGDRCKVKEIIINDDGSKNYELEEIIGREEEILSLSNGKNVSRFSLALKLLPDDVYESQIHFYKETQKAILFYKADQSIEEKKFDYFVNKFNSMVCAEYSLSIKRTKEMKQNKLGKVKTIFINE